MHPKPNLTDIGSVEYHIIKTEQLEKLKILFLTQTPQPAL